MKKIIQQLKEVWYLLAFIVAFAMWTATINTKLSSIEASDEQQNQKIEQISVIQTDVAVTKQKVTSIEENVNRIINILE